jgi:hypothetical protein
MPKNKRPAKTYDIVTFVAADVFPPSNPLAMDILRLMAAYNDLSEILQWIIATRPVVTKPMALKRARIRMTIQSRILLGHLHEAFVVFDKMQGTPEFKAMTEQGFLSELGQEVLKRLRQANTGKTSTTMRSRLAVGRNLVAFHYVREAFQEGAMTFSKMFVEKDRAKSHILYEGGRAYFYFAEQVRENVAFGFNEKEGDAQIAVKLGQYLRDAQMLTQDMGWFTDEVFTAYIAMKNLLSALDHSTVKE